VRYYLIPYFIVQKFGEELEFKVRYGFPPWLSLLNEKKKCLQKKAHKNKILEKKEK